MTIKLLAIGKTDSTALQQLLVDYSKRLGHYIKFELKTIPDLKNAKNLSEKQQKEKEGELILKHIGPSEILVLMDEQGRQYSSLEFSVYLQKKMNSGLKGLTFAIGGPYGFSRGDISEGPGQAKSVKNDFFPSNGTTVRN